MSVRFQPGATASHQTQAQQQEPEAGTGLALTAAAVSGLAFVYSLFSKDSSWTFTAVCGTAFAFTAKKVSEAMNTFGPQQQVELFSFMNNKAHIVLTGQSIDLQAPLKRFYDAYGQVASAKPLLDCVQQIIGADLSADFDETTLDANNIAFYAELTRKQLERKLIKPDVAAERLGILVNAAKELGLGNVPFHQQLFAIHAQIGKSAQTKTAPKPAAVAANPAQTKAAPKPAATAKSHAQTKAQPKPAAVEAESAEETDAVSESTSGELDLSDVDHENVLDYLSAVQQERNVNQRTIYLSEIMSRLGGVSQIDKGVLRKIQTILLSAPGNSSAQNAATPAGTRRVSVVAAARTKSASDRKAAEASAAAHNSRTAAPTRGAAAVRSTSGAASAAVKRKPIVGASQSASGPAGIAAAAMKAGRTLRPTTGGIETGRVAPSAEADAEQPDSPQQAVPVRRMPSKPAARKWPSVDTSAAAASARGGPSRREATPVAPKAPPAPILVDDAVSEDGSADATPPAPPTPPAVVRRAAAPRRAPEAVADEASAGGGAMGGGLLAAIRQAGKASAKRQATLQHD